MSFIYKILLIKIVILLGEEEGGNFPWEILALNPWIWPLALGEVVILLVEKEAEFFSW